MPLGREGSVKCSHFRGRKVSKDGIWDSKWCPKMVFGTVNGVQRCIWDSNNGIWDSKWCPKMVFGTVNGAQRWYLGRPVY